MAVFVAVSLTTAAAIVIMHLGAFSEKFQDVLLESVVRTA